MTMRQRISQRITMEMPAVPKVAVLTLAIVAAVAAMTIRIATKRKETQQAAAKVLKSPKILNYPMRMRMELKKTLDALVIACSSEIFHLLQLKKN